jgi:hypothetical protein
MPIENSEGGGFVITGEHIAIYRCQVVASGLALEVKTGMTVSRGRSSMLVANSISGKLDVEALAQTSGVRIKPLGCKRTKLGALEDLVLFLRLVYRWEPIPTVAGVLGEERMAKLDRLAQRIIDGQLAYLAQGGEK